MNKEKMIDKMGKAKDRVPQVGGELTQEEMDAMAKEIEEDEDER